MRRRYWVVSRTCGHPLPHTPSITSSVLRHAAWAVDELPVEQAVEAARVAKIYCARAAFAVAEMSIQVHGGIGNTWECLAHIYLRRVLAATEACDESCDACN